MNAIEPFASKVPYMGAVGNHEVMLALLVVLLVVLLLVVLLLMLLLPVLVLCVLVLCVLTPSLLQCGGANREHYSRRFAGFNYAAKNSKAQPAGSFASGDNLWYSWDAGDARAGAVAHTLVLLLLMLVLLLMLMLFVLLVLLLLLLLVLISCTLLPNLGLIHFVTVNTEVNHIRIPVVNSLSKFLLLILQFDIKRRGIAQTWTPPRRWAPATASGTPKPTALSRTNSSNGWKQILRRLTRRASALPCHGLSCTRTRPSTCSRVQTSRRSTTSPTLTAWICTSLATYTSTRCGAAVRAAARAAAAAAACAAARAAACAAAARADVSFTSAALLPAAQFALWAQGKDPSNCVWIP